MTEPHIHPSAVVHSTAKLHSSVKVGAFTVIDEHVEIAEGTTIGPHVYLKGPTRIGKNNKIYQFSSIGEDPQDKKFKGELSLLVIGDGNIIRESVTINRGTEQAGGATRIGNNNLLMAYVHIAHDCQVGSGIVFSNNASIAGHVFVDDFANLGGFVGVHQFCKIGTRAFLAGGSMVTKDVPPFLIVSGYPARPFGINKVGLLRAGFTEEDLNLLRQIYKIMYRQGLTTDEAFREIQKLPENPHVKHFLEFFTLDRHRSFIR